MTKKNPDFGMLFAQLGCVIEQQALLQKALTHRSYCADHNERLEFLGDSVLNLCTSDWLMRKLPQASEGELSRTRANLVNEASLHCLALRLGLPALLRLGEGERKTGGTRRPSILADALEAIIGAVYLEKGFSQARQVVEHLFEDVDLSSSAAVAKAKDAKTSLQEWLQGRHLPLPAYRLEKTTGAAHTQTFVVVCEVAPLKIVASGQGSSRKAAEQQAASEALHSLTNKEQGNE